jgi:tRNA (guanine-N7-)-methyltransferase
VKVAAARLANPSSPHVGGALRYAASGVRYAEWEDAHVQPRIQTFKPRRGRYSAQQREALERATHLVELTDTENLPAIFGELPVILDIGFGMGGATLEQATMHPQYGILAVDVHTPGVGRLLADTEGRCLANIRVLEGDAMQVLHAHLADASLVGIRVFFPDPWPKSRHHKRRIITSTNLDIMAQRLAPEGFLHFATDWQEYADWARQALDAHPAFELLDEHQQPDIASRATRPQTKFELRGIAAGRAITDLVARRIPAH